MGTNLSITTIDKKVHNLLSVSLGGLPSSRVKHIIYKDLCQEL